MSAGGRLALLAGGWALGAAPAFAQAPKEVPRTFSACAERFIAAMNDRPHPPKFGCAQSYMSSLPQGGGGTREELGARSQAIEAADLYIETALVPALEQRLKGETDSRGDYRMGKVRLLAAALGAARLYNQTLCDFVEEAVGPGTYRAVAAAECRVRNRDRLIDDLLWARLEFTQGVD
jgi:hypothetical protein